MYISNLKDFICQTFIWLVICSILLLGLETLVDLQRFITEKNLIQVIVDNKIVYEGPLYKTFESSHGITIYKSAFFSKVEAKYISKNIEVKPLNEI